VRKSYLAIVHGHTALRGHVEAPLGKDEKSLVAIKDGVRPDGAPSRTDFELVRHFTRPEGTFSLLRVRPWTGRKHQIRIHLAHLGHPIVGDKIYGKDEGYYLAFVRGDLQPIQQKELLTEHHCLHAELLDGQLESGVFSFAAPAESWFDEFARGGK
jgi:23S rRNA pseudouridine1911/1915/1917 synthase